MRARFLCVVGALITACGGADSSLPGVVAPSTPPITQPGVAELVPVTSTSFTAAPGGTVLLQVRALRADGGPAHAVAVVFKVQAGGGAIQPIITSTDEQGLGSTRWTFGPRAAVNLATATSLAPTPVSFTVSTFASGTAP